MKKFIIVAMLASVAAVSALAQAEALVKKKAKDLKRDIETQQTNQIKGATNAPARR